MGDAGAQDKVLWFGGSATHMLIAFLMLKKNGLNFLREKRVKRPMDLAWRRDIKEY